MMMNTLDIIKDLSENCKTRKLFLGVYPSNLLPKEKLKRPCMLVANTDPSSSPGQHWCAFYLPGKKGTKGRKRPQAELFDSFNSTPVMPAFKHFLERNCSSYITCGRQLQSNFSTVCGNYAVMYLYYRSIGKTLKQFMQMFTHDNYECNDEKVMQLYHKYIRLRKKNKKMRNYVQGGGSSCFNKTQCIQNCKAKCKR